LGPPINPKLTVQTARLVLGKKTGLAVHPRRRREPPASPPVSLPVNSIVKQYVHTGQAGLKPFFWTICVKKYHFLLVRLNFAVTKFFKSKENS
jgi:hypothetical protein